MMRRNFNHVLVGQEGGIANRIIAQFGAVRVVDDYPERGEEHFVFVDCATVPLARDWVEAMVALPNKPLGLLRMDDADRKILSDVAGREFSDTVTNVMFRRRDSGDKPFTFTLLPNLQDKDIDAAGAAERLEKQVFPILCSSPPPPNPPETVNRVWPQQRLNEFCGTLVEWSPLTAIHQPTIPDYEGLTIDFKYRITAYFYRNLGGRYGDGNYHAIFLTQITDVTPSASIPTSRLLIIGTSYEVSVLPTRNSQPVTTGLTAYATSPASSAPRSSPEYGNIIETTLQKDFNVEGVPAGSENPQNIQFASVFQQIINQNSFANISSVTIDNKDTATENCISFSVGGQQSAGNQTPGAFTVVNHMMIDRTNPVPPPINLNVRIAVNMVSSGYLIGPPIAGPKYSFTIDTLKTIDLEAQTNLQEVPHESSV
ncbi:MAG: hypothetical protein AAFR73_11070 [Pseudomonadota bacterium]